MDLIRESLNTWLREPKRSFSNGRVTLGYRVLSDEGFPLKLKVEINSREHFSILGFQITLLHAILHGLQERLSFEP